MAEDETVRQHGNEFCFAKIKNEKLVTDHKMIIQLISTHFLRLLQRETIVVFNVLLKLFKKDGQFVFSTLRVVSWACEDFFDFSQHAVVVMGSPFGLSNSRTDSLGLTGYDTDDQLCSICHKVGGDGCRQKTGFCFYGQLSRVVMHQLFRLVGGDGQLWEGWARRVPNKGSEF
ncbi:hypothetical protein GPALN_013314 [Globodera pallida]|nr:hypothetical protein GPALN_013314 [Globodera pallida]